MAPFEEFVGDAGRARGRLVRCAGKVAQDLFLQYGRKAAGGKWSWILRVRVRDGLGDDGKKAVRKDLLQISVRGGKGSVEFQEGGNFVGAPAMVPGSGFPQCVTCDCGEVVIGPSVFGLCDSLA